MFRHHVANSAVFLSWWILEKVEKMCDTLQLNWKLPSTNTTTKKANRKSTKKDPKAYSFRACSIQKRMESQGKKDQPKKRGPKPRPKTAPMSKYRRKTANMRERQRMGEINNAFDTLKSKIPTLANNFSAKGKCEKMTKINVLHVAINYIRALENLLETGDAGVNVYGTAVVQSPFKKTIYSENALMDCESTQSSSASTTSSSAMSPLSDCNNPEEIKSVLMELEKNESLKHGNNDDEPDDEDDNEKVCNYSSEDSGIHDDECPDWTELTSTLDFPPPQQAPLNQPPPPPPPLFKVNNLPTSLPSPSSSASWTSSPASSPQSLSLKDNNNLDMTMCMMMSKDSKDHGFSNVENHNRKFNDNNNNKSTVTTNGKSLIPDLIGDDLFNDLNDSFESIDGLCFNDDIMAEDPFQLPIF